MLPSSANLLLFALLFETITMSFSVFGSRAHRPGGAAGSPCAGSPLRPGSVCHGCLIDEEMLLVPVCGVAWTGRAICWSSWSVPLAFGLFLENSAHGSIKCPEVAFSHWKQVVPGGNDFIKS